MKKKPNYSGCFNGPLPEVASSGNCRPVGSNPITHIEMRPDGGVYDQYGNRIAETKDLIEQPDMPFAK